MCFIKWLKFLHLYVVIILHAQTSILPWSKRIASICLYHLSNILRHNAGNKQCKISTHKTYRTYVYARDELTLSSRSCVEHLHCTSLCHSSDFHFAFNTFRNLPKRYGSNPFAFESDISSKNTLPQFGHSVTWACPSVCTAAFKYRQGLFSLTLSLPSAYPERIVSESWADLERTVSRPWADQECNQVEANKHTYCYINVSHVPFTFLVAALEETVKCFASLQELLYIYIPGGSSRFA